MNIMAYRTNTGRIIMNEQWIGRKVAFFGGSFTDKKRIGTTKVYWEYLAESCGIVPLPYGINGNSWKHVIPQAEQLLAEHGTDVDAIFIFMGTNDYNSSVPLGVWYDLREEETNCHGVMKTKMRRYFNTSGSTVRGRINAAMGFLKRHFPLQQIVLMTPPHRAFARFSETNVQPEESFPNELDRYLEDYVECIREAGDIWSVPLIDLYSDCGLFPVFDEYTRFFHHPETDRLHPNAAGHRRIAETIRYRIQTLPATFRDL